MPLKKPDITIGDCDIDEVWKFRGNEECLRQLLGL